MGIKLSKGFKKKLSVLFSIMVLCLLVSMNVCAAPETNAPVDTGGIETLQAKFDVLKNLMATVMSSVGMVLSLWSIGQIGIAMRMQEGSGVMARNFLSLGGALILLFAPQIVVAFL